MGQYDGIISRKRATVELSCFNSSEETHSGPSFKALPEEPILTLGMDIPNSWLVRPKESSHDLDNLQIGNILSRQDSSVIDVRFELEQLVIEGHAREHGSSPPRGLQLQLVDSHGKEVSETSVMANVGYFQFKANPGVYKLHIRDGHGQSIYDMISMTGQDSFSVNGNSQMAVTSFNGLTILPIFKRKSGMEAVDVLEAPVSTPGFVNKIYSS